MRPLAQEIVGPVPDKPPCPGPAAHRQALAPRAGEFALHSQTVNLHSFDELNSEDVAGPPHSTRQNAPSQLHPSFRMSPASNVNKCSRTNEATRGPLADITKHPNTNHSPRACPRQVAPVHAACSESYQQQYSTIRAVDHFHQPHNRLADLSQQKIGHRS
jgi:hypothetical protein